MSKTIIPFPLDSSFRQGVPGWQPSDEEVRGLPGTEVEIRNRTYGGLIALRALRYTGSANLSLQAGQLLKINGDGASFSGLTSAATDFAYPASPFIRGTLTVTPGDVVWAVVSGIVPVKKTGSAISAGVFVTPSTTAGQAQASAAGTRVFGVAMAAAAAADATVVVNVGANWGEAL